MHSTPRDINTYIDIHNEKQQQEYDMREHVAWMHGIYVMNAIATCFAKGHDYPDNPLLPKAGDIHDIARKTGRNEQEMKNELLMMQFLVGEANSKILKVEEELEKSNVVEES